MPPQIYKRKFGGVELMLSKWKVTVKDGLIKMVDMSI